MAGSNLGPYATMINGITKGILGGIAVRNQNEIAKQKLALQERKLSAEQAAAEAIAQARAGSVSAAQTQAKTQVGKLNLDIAQVNAKAEMDASKIEGEINKIMGDFNYRFGNEQQKADAQAQISEAKLRKQAILLAAPNRQAALAEIRSAKSRKALHKTLEGLRLKGLFNPALKDSDPLFESVKIKYNALPQ